MTHLRQRQRGVVVLVVLSILATLGLLLLQVSLTAREDVARAQLLSDRVEASLELRTQQARLELALLTYPWAGAIPSAEDPLARIWRFDDQPFAIGGTTFRIQDVGGLFVMPLPGYNAGLRMLPALLQAIDIHPQAAAALVDHLSQRINPPMLAPLQDVGELLGVGGLTGRELERLRAVSTLYSVQKFNPGLAPEAVLASVYQGSARDAILALRRSGAMNPVNMAKIAGDLDPDMAGFSVGPVFRVTLQVRRGEVALAREATIEVDPYGPDPIKRWATRRVPARADQLKQ